MQQRDRLLLEDVGRLKLTTSNQILRTRGFGSVRRCNSVLHRLVAADLLRRFFIGTIAGGKRAVYCLSTRGAALVSAKAPAINYRQDQLIVADQFITHQLQISEVYLACKYNPLPGGVSLKSWGSFSGPLTEAIRLIPDGYVEFDTPKEVRPLFVEVDLGTESRRIWQQKIQMYLQLAISGEFSRVFSRSRFGVLVIANSERRLRSIRQVIAAVTDKLFWLATVSAITDQGLGATIWLRPTGEDRVCLFN